MVYSECEAKMNKTQWLEVKAQLERNVTDAKLARNAAHRKIAIVATIPEVDAAYAFDAAYAAEDRVKSAETVLWNFLYVGDDAPEFPYGEFAPEEREHFE